MNLGETFRTAYEAIKSHRMRSTLTVLGILIGIAAVMLTVALGEAARTMVLSQITSMGTNLIVVVPGGAPPEGSEDGYVSFSSTALTLADVEALSDPVNAPDVGGVAPTTEFGAEVKAGENSSQVQMSGSTPDWLAIRGRSMQTGRFFNDADLDQGTSVVVLGTTTARNLFGSDDPLGQTVNISSQNFTVIGVMASAGSSMGMDQDDTIVLPRTTMLQRVMLGENPNEVSMIYLQARSQETLTLAYQQIENTLLTLHGTPRGSADFSIYTQQSLIDTANSTTAILTATLGGIAAISLLVGGIGVMNIMLVSVTERVREIGLRKALGATPGVIRNQFLVEASMLGLLGGVLGLLLGMGGAWLIATLSGYPVIPSIGSTLIALGVSLLIGIIAGVYPAARAARLAPIDALRSE